MKLEKRIISYEPFDPLASELMTLREAAEYLGIKLSGITGLVDRNTLTEIRDADAMEHGRRYATRFVLKAEVEELARQRQAEAEAK